MTRSVDRPERRTLLVVLAAAVVAIAAAIGAYVDWLWWPAYSGLMLTIAGIAVVLVGGVAALLTRGVVRTGAWFVLAAGVGLLLGQNLGPSREPLHDVEGTMTLTLTSPVAATATAAGACTLGASGTEFSISGDPNMRLEVPDRPFVSVYLTKGDRWMALRGADAHRYEDVMFSVDVTPVAVPADGGPATVSMAAGPDSTIEATFTNAGGSMTFAGLEPRTGLDFTGESMDLAGTLTWTCDEDALLIER